MKITRRQLRRIIKEAITTVSDEEFDKITMPGYNGPQPGPAGALTAADKKVLEMTGYNIWRDLNDPTKYNSRDPDAGAEAMWLDADFYNDSNYSAKQKEVVGQNEDAMLQYLADTIMNVRDDKIGSGLNPDVHVRNQRARK